MDVEDPVSLEPFQILLQFSQHSSNSLEGVHWVKNDASLGGNFNQLSYIKRIKSRNFDTNLARIIIH